MGSSKPRSARRSSGAARYILTSARSQAQNRQLAVELPVPPPPQDAVGEKGISARGLRERGVQMCAFFPSSLLSDRFLDCRSMGSTGSSWVENRDPVRERRSPNGFGGFVTGASRSTFPFFCELTASVGNGSAERSLRLWTHRLRVAGPRHRGPRLGPVSLPEGSGEKPRLPRAFLRAFPIAAREASKLKFLSAGKEAR
jgi:hypothetical protein